MDRRMFLGTLAGGLLAAEGQQADKMARIGWLAVNLAAFHHVREAFLQGLRKLGYVEGRNVVIEYRSTEGKSERLSRSCGRTGCAQGRCHRGPKHTRSPIEQPNKFELVINLKTAKALGLSIPPSLLQPADQVIE